jgi:hypothetical protein
MARPFLPKELVKNKSVKVRFTKEEKEQIKKICQEQKVTFSKFLRDAIFFQYKIKIN